MSKERRQEISAKGGKRSHELGRAHRFTSSDAREAGRAGGTKVSSDREHMSTIGKKGAAKRVENMRKRSDEEAAE